MALSVQLQSTDEASGQKRMITLVKTGATTLAAHYATSADPDDVSTYNLSNVKADPDQGKISVSYGFLISATGTVTEDPPSVSADAGLLGKHTFPLQAGDYDKIIDFLRRANFPSLA